ncbi:MAG TPA: hypothetical protein VKB49_01445 [Candidatus Sulfotelmatobacter sp.]|nr:hypothetical protein [Candidatus Sulfotelmatobacter sp.]
MKSLRVLIVLLCSSTLAFAGGREFHGLVRSIETTYGVHHMHIPLLGVALFFARPAGAHGLRLALFEGFKTPADSEGFCRLIESSLGPGWSSFVRVRSKGEADGETTLIYVNPSAGSMHLMIVNVEPSEAQVIEVSLSDRQIKKWLKEPGEEAEHQSGHHHQYD